MAHLTCVAHTRLELAEILVDYRKAGIENLLALGGDPPVEASDGAGELAYALELVELARAIGGFSVGVAAHPELHPRSPDRDDRPRPPGRQAARSPTSPSPSSSSGVERLLRPHGRRLAALGVDKPVIARHHAGHQPRLGRSAWPSCPAPRFPPELVDRLDGRGRRARRRAPHRRRDRHRAVRRSCSAEGAPGLHFYTLNRSTATQEIYANLGLASGLAGGRLAGHGRQDHA